MSTVLLVDDDDQLRNSFQKLLEGEGYSVRAATSGEAALRLVESMPTLPDTVIMDVRMPGLGGLATLRQLREKEPRLPVIIMTAYSTTEDAIEATKLGAFDYILKPFDIPDILALLEKALEAGRMMREQVSLPSANEKNAKDAIIGSSKAMHDVYKAIGRAAPTDALVLLRGESGTGKELAARALYQYSERNKKPFSIVNCAAIPETLLESELFGFERGAFTGAHVRRIGKIEQANGGTVFLDEIGDISLNVQAKLLRLLQEKQIERLGGREHVHTDVRILAATNRNLEQAVADGRFREDLYYRLNVVTITMPPLRDRVEDIPLLVRHFIRRFRESMGGHNPEFTPEALARLARHLWPGNVRELVNLVQKILVLHQGGPVTGADIDAALNTARDGNASPTARAHGVQAAAQTNNQTLGTERAFCPHDAQDLPQASSQTSGSPAPVAHFDLSSFVAERLKSSKAPKSFDALMDEVAKATIEEALRMCNGNRSHTAEMLGLSRPTLLAKMGKYGL